MIQLFKSLLGESNRESATKKIASTPRPKSPASQGDYRAVSIAPCARCQAAAKDAASKRYLLRDAPRLPLADCTAGSACSCKFRKHPDRRDSDRRVLGEMETRRWFAGSERRDRCTRRSTRA
jgi:hypothetical protein